MTTSASATTGRDSNGLVLLAMIVVVAMTFIDMTIVSIAAPDIQKGLGLSMTGLQWVVSGYLVAMAAVFALGGRLADVFGHRTMVIVGTLVFVGSSVACGLTPAGAHADEWIVGFRIVQGVGAALMFPAALAVVLGAYWIERRGSAVARFFSAAGGLTAVGPFVGSYLVGISWRWIFFINVPVAVVGLVLTFVAGVDDRRRREPIDLLGALLIAVGAGALVAGLQQASTWGWSDLRTLACLVGGLVVLGIFVEVERVRTDPLIRVRFFENRTFTAQNVILFLASVAFVPVFFFASVYAQVGLGWGAGSAGTYLLIIFGGFAPGTQVAGRLVDKGAARTAAVWGGLIGAAGFWAWSSRLVGLSENTQWPWMLVAGFGMGLIIGSSNTDAVNQVPSDDYGQATGITQTARNYGASLGLAILGTLQLFALRHRIQDTLTPLGVPKEQADQIANALHGSGGGSASQAFAQFGRNAGEVFQAVRVDFAEASQLAFRGLAVLMLIAAVVALFGLPRHRTPAPEHATNSVDDADSEAASGAR